MAADCEIGGCGVLAVGRCAECGQAMCASHRSAVDQCRECGEKAFIGARPGTTHFASSPQVQECIGRIESVARRLVGAGFPPDSLVHEAGRWGRGVLGGRKWVRDPGRDLYGWFVGEYVWRMPDNSPRSDGGQVKESARTFVTADGRLVKEGGHAYEVGKPLPRYVPVNGESGPFGGGALRLEFWEEILAKMVEVARRRGVNVR